MARQNTHLITIKLIFQKEYASHHNISQNAMGKQIFFSAHDDNNNTYAEKKNTIQYTHDATAGI